MAIMGRRGTYSVLYPVQECRDQEVACVPGKFPWFFSRPSDAFLLSWLPVNLGRAARSWKLGRGGAMRGLGRLSWYRADPV